MKIYIVGAPGSGKTTLAKKLSQKYKTKHYELDCLVFDDADNHRRRTDKEIKELFDQILEKKSWIIEDVGRSKFHKGFEKCDTIYYIKLSKLTILSRILKRWLKQRLGKEEYNYPPTFAQLVDMIRTGKSYFKKEPAKLEVINKHKEKVTFLKKKDLNNIIK